MPDLDTLSAALDTELANLNRALLTFAAAVESFGRLAVAVQAQATAEAVTRAAVARQQEAQP